MTQALQITAVVAWAIAATVNGMRGNVVLAVVCAIVTILLLTAAVAVAFAKPTNT